MNIKKCTLATIASFIVMYLLSYLWYAVLMKDFYANAVVAATPDEIKAITRPQMLIPFIALAWIERGTVRKCVEL